MVLSVSGVLVLPPIGALLLSGQGAAAAPMAAGRPACTGAMGQEVLAGQGALLAQGA